MMSLLRKLQPKHWFAAHLHVKYEATVNHGGDVQLQQDVAVAPAEDDEAPEANPDEIVLDDMDDMDEPVASTSGITATAGASMAATSGTENPDEIAIDDEGEFDAPSAPELSATTQTPLQHANTVGDSRSTKFLALDKCLPRRSFLEVLDVQTPQPVTDTGPVFTLDPEWLAISKALHPFLSTTKTGLPLPSEETARVLVDREREWATSTVGSMEIKDVQEFAKTAASPIQKDKNVRQRKCSVFHIQRELMTSHSAMVHKSADGRFLQCLGGHKQSQPTTVLNGLVYSLINHVVGPSYTANVGYSLGVRGL